MRVGSRRSIPRGGLARSRILRTSEYPLECGPLAASPRITSPGRIERPSTMRSFSTTPSANPARSYSSLGNARSEEHTSELQSLAYLVCRLLLEKKISQHVSHYEYFTILPQDPPL